MSIRWIMARSIERASAPRLFPFALHLLCAQGMNHHADSILIVDFGSQVTQLIARRVREAGVYSEIAPFTSAEEAFERMKPKGIILSGSPAGVPEKGSPRAPQKLFDSGKYNPHRKAHRRTNKHFLHQDQQAGDPVAQEHTDEQEDQEHAEAQ